MNTDNLLSSGELSGSDDEPLKKIARRETKPCMKRRVNDVWKNVALENVLDAAITATCFTSEDCIPVNRSCESYVIENSVTEETEHCANEKISRKRPFKDRLGQRTYNLLTSRENYGVDFDSPLEEVTKAISKVLNEDNMEILSKVLHVIGTKRSLEFCYLAEDIESRGGFFVADGSRRRTAGGVFLTLIRKSDSVSKAEKKAIFKETSEWKILRKKQRRTERRRSKINSMAVMQPELLERDADDLENMPSPDIHIEAVDD